MRRPRYRSTVLLKACLNGARTTGAHPSLPVTPAAIARDAAAVQVAGAGAVHVHAKDPAGVDTLEGAAVDAVVAAVRRAAPGFWVGVSTGAWAMPDPRGRVDAIGSWTVRPDFASVNWHEDGAEAVAAALLQQGVGVEAGLWHEDAVAAWAASPYRDRCLRVLLELPDDPDSERVRETAEMLLAQVRAATGDAVPILLHGEGRSTWPVLRTAAALGLDTRIGLEDTLTLPDGSPAEDNAALVRAALAAAGPTASR